MNKKILPSILIIIFSFSAFTRIEGSDEIKPILFITILIMGIGIGVLIKTIYMMYNQKKKDETI